MSHVPLGAPAQVKFHDTEHSAHVSRHLPGGNYAVTVEENGLMIFSSSSSCLNIKISLSHPEVGASARILPPNSTQWIDCSVKTLLDPAPRVLLESRDVDTKPPPLFETDTFPYISVTLEYLNDGKKNTANTLHNSPPPIGTDVEVCILGAWKMGTITEYQGESHFVVEVPGIGRLFSQSFGLLEYKTRIKHPQLGTKAVVHLPTGNIACSVVQHSAHPHSYILAAVSDDTLLFDSRVLYKLDIKITLNDSNANQASPELSVKEEDATEIEQEELDSPPLCSENKPASQKRRRTSIPPGDESDNDEGISVEDIVLGGPPKKKTKRSTSNVGTQKIVNTAEKTSSHSKAPSSGMNSSRKLDVSKKTSIAEQTRKAKSNDKDGDYEVNEDPAAQVINELAKLPNAKAITLVLRREGEVDEGNSKVDQICEQTIEEDLRNRFRKKFEDAPASKMEELISLARSEIAKRGKAQSGKGPSSKMSGNYRVIVVENDGTRKKRYPHEPWMDVLSSAVCIKYDIKYMVVPHDSEPTVFVFYGLQPNVEHAVCSFRAAFDHVHRLQLGYKCSRKKHGRKPVAFVRASYALGIVHSLLAAVRAAAKEQAECNAYELAEKNGDVEFDDYMNNELKKHKLVEKAHNEGRQDSVKVRL